MFMLSFSPFPQRGKVARRAGWGDFLYGRVGGYPVCRMHHMTDKTKQRPLAGRIGPGSERRTAGARKKRCAFSSKAQ